MTRPETTQSGSVPMSTRLLPSMLEKTTYAALFSVAGEKLYRAAELTQNLSWGAIQELVAEYVGDKAAGIQETAVNWKDFAWTSCEQGMEAMPKGIEIPSFRGWAASAPQKISQAYATCLSSLPALPECMESVQEMGSGAVAKLSTTISENIEWAGPVAGIAVCSQVANRALQGKVENGAARYSLSKLMGAVAFWGAAQTTAWALGTDGIGMGQVSNFALRALVTEVGLKVAYPFASAGVQGINRFVIEPMGFSMNSDKAAAKLKRS